MEYMKYKLENIGKIITGSTPSTKKDDYYSSKDYMFVGPSDLKKGKYITTSEKYISEIALLDNKTRILDKGSICVDCIGSDMGNVAIVSERCMSNQQINAITEIDNNFNSEYIYYLLSTMKDYFHLIGKNGSTMPIINKSLFSSIEIYLPKKIIQDRIVGILAQLDKKIELNNQINDNLCYVT